MMKKERTTTNGTMTYEFPTSGVLLNTMVGHYSMDMVVFCLAGMSECMQQRVPAVMFFDWEKMIGYDPDCRREMTRWHKEHKDQIGKVHMLVRSSLVKMGISAANLALRMAGIGDAIEPYDNRAKFEAALRTACRR